MTTEEHGRSGADAPSGSRATHEADKSSSPEASIPNAATVLCIIEAVVSEARRQLTAGSCDHDSWIAVSAMDALTSAAYRLFGEVHERGGDALEFGTIKAALEKAR